MDTHWQKAAQRMVHGLGVQPGELIDVRDGSGDMDLLLETCLSIEKIGATPLVQLRPDIYLNRLWVEAAPEILAASDRHRLGWMQQVDRVLVIGGARADVRNAPTAALEAWEQAQYRLTLVEEERRLPYLVAAVPTPRGARQLGMDMSVFESVLLPALEASAEELRQEINRVLSRVKDGQSIQIASGKNHILHLEHGGRTWLSDDGWIDAADRQQGAIVSNLPAGSIYTTVLEDRTRGSLWLPKAGPAVDVVLHFDAGRIIQIDAASGADLLASELDSHSGEPRRVSHIGIGLNPHLHQLTGWTIVDEHAHGCMFFALGENRYMGGQNESSVNVDYVLPGATLRVDGEVIVSQGKVFR